MPLTLSAYHHFNHTICLEVRKSRKRKTKASLVKKWEDTYL